MKCRCTGACEVQHWNLLQSSPLRALVCEGGCTRPLGPGRQRLVRGIPADLPEGLPDAPPATAGCLWTLGRGCIRICAQALRPAGLQSSLAQITCPQHPHQHVHQVLSIVSSIEAAGWGCRVQTDVDEMKSPSRTRPRTQQQQHRTLHLCLCVHPSTCLSFYVIWLAVHTSTCRLGCFRGSDRLRGLLVWS